MRLPCSPIRAIYVAAFLSSFGGFVVAPYLAVNLTQRETFSPYAASFLIGLMFFLVKGAALLSGYVSRRAGLLGCMLTGNLLRVLGYPLFFIDNQISVICGIGLIGLGGGLFFPPSKAYLLAISEGEQQLDAMANRNMFANVGVAAGPLVGFIGFKLLGQQFFVWVALIFIAMVALLYLRLDFNVGKTPHKYSTDRLSINSKVLFPCLRAFVLGVMLIQLETSLPIRLHDADLGHLIPLIFFFNAVFVAGGQKLIVGIYKHSTLLVATAAMSAAAILGFLTLSRIDSNLYYACLALFGGLLLISLSEIATSIQVDDHARRNSTNVIAQVYGLISFFEGLGAVVGGFTTFDVIHLFGNEIDLPGSMVLSASFIAALAIGSVFLGVDRKQNTV